MTSGGLSQALTAPCQEVVTLGAAGEMPVASTYLEVRDLLYISEQGPDLLQDIGEFSSPKQGTFYHYNDFWRLDPSTREWTRLETKGKAPPARSGHRMVPYKVSSETT